MELRDYLALGRKWWWLLLACVVAGGGVAYAVRSLESPRYEAQATILVNQTERPGTLAYNDVLTSERLAETYRRMIPTRPVLDDAQATLQLPGGPDELMRRISADAVPETQLVRVSSWASTPDEAAAIANEVVTTVLRRNAAGEFGQRESLTLVEPAITPDAPANGGTVLAALLGAVAGGILAVGTVVTVEYLDDRVRDPDRLRALAVPLLGTIQRMKHGRDRLVTDRSPESPEVEAYRVVRTAIQFALLDRPWRSLFVTSARVGEGKTTTAVNLAIVAAQAGRRVVVIDADLRRPALHRVFNRSNRRGLTDLLLDQDAAARDWLQDTDVENCSVLTTGPLPPNPDSVLGTSRLKDVVDEVARDADMVVIDGPPVLSVADAGYLASVADGTVLVINARRTRRASVTRALAALHHATAHVVGAVLNQARGQEAYGYYSYERPTDAPVPQVSPNGVRSGTRTAAGSSARAKAVGPAAAPRTRRARTRPKGGAAPRRKARPDAT